MAAGYNMFNLNTVSWIQKQQTISFELIPMRRFASAIPSTITSIILSANKRNQEVELEKWCLVFSYAVVFCEFDWNEMKFIYYLGKELKEWGAEKEEVLESGA